MVFNRVMDVNETSKGEIIVATTKGLSILKNPEGKGVFKNYYFVKGLSNSFIYGLLRDNKGSFWMTTNFGISVFDPEKQEFKSYSADDGVCINEFNSAGFHKAYDGELLFGGLGGLVSIYPDKQIINKSVPDIFLKSVRIENFNDSISTAGLSTLNLSHSQNKLFFEFSVPDFSGADNINLFYRVQLNSTSWTKVNPSKVFSIAFANLAPGSYNLVVKAVNTEGVESKQFTFPFVISPPFWNTWWFFILIIVGIIIATWAVYRIRLHNKITHMRELEEIRKEENEKVRKAAALDLHDEFGNGLTRISMLVEMARIHVSKDNKEATGILDVISQNTSRLYQGTKDFIWSINPGNDNLYEIIIRIKDFGDELFYGTGCEFQVSGLQEEFKNIKQHPSSGRNIAMIFKEALSNSMKHSKANKVKLSIEPNGVAIAVKLKDNGTGFEMRSDKNSFGLSNMQQRAQKAGATLQIQSEKEGGTEIILKINKNI
jgi:signal transduction histidine kinase